MKSFSQAKFLVYGLCSALALCFTASTAFAWGDEGHEVIGLIADHFLDPAVRARVNAILTGDDSHLASATDIAHEATWADKYRDSDRDTTQVHYRQTRNWHFVDLELGGPDLKSACFGARGIPAGKMASQGPADDCIVDKIEQFAAELGRAGIDAQERRLALQFVLHFVGDLQQPLHASDEHDEGGNLKIVSAPGIRVNNLHHDWDIEFVKLLGRDETQVARQLIAQITPAQRQAWSSGTAVDWARESFAIARDHAYGLLPPPRSPNHYRLTRAYVADAKTVTAAQLSKAGVRLAYVLNRALR